MTYSEHRRRSDREFLADLMAMHSSTTQAASAAGVSRTTLYKIAARCGFTMPRRPAGNRGTEAWQRLTAESRLSP